ncbi:MAG TPA: helix-turn-helix domain-containing protein [Candidatus Binataceae bacterium]|jgi:AcrR family transcriptional regulator
MSAIINIDTAAADAPRSSTPGRAERAKRDKLRRIKRAARKLFEQRGFEATTTREIAAEADIGAGTLFLYAGSKEDLLVMIFRDDIGCSTDRAFATLPRKPLLDQILHVFQAMIAHHAAHPALARVFVKELPFVRDDRHGMTDFITSLFARLGELIDRAARSGELRSDIPVLALAHNVFAIYFQSLQRWLGAKVPSSVFHEASLRDSIELQLSGFRKRSPRSVKPKTAGPPARLRANAPAMLHRSKS